MPIQFLDPATCRECGGLPVRPMGSIDGAPKQCSNCGANDMATASDAWRQARDLLMALGRLPGDDAVARLMRFRDEGHAAGRAEALEELRREVLEMPFHRIAGSDNLLLKDDVYIAITRALAGKL